MNATDAGVIFGDQLGAFSAEITANDKKALDNAAAMMKRGMPIYVAALPRSSASELIDKVAHARAVGLDPIPHLVARNYESVAEFGETMSALAERAAITKALVLGGDRDDPAGPFDNALDLIETGLLQENGVRGISLGCYPEGHPRVADDILLEALKLKVKAAADAGLAVRLITQICFDAGAIISFVERIRDEGIVDPLRVGVVGPTKFSTLLKYAAACGVGPSLRSLTERSDMHLKLLSGYKPDALLDAVSDAVRSKPHLNIVGAHFFTFGSLKKSMEWIQEEPRMKLSFQKPPFFEWNDVEETDRHPLTKC